MQTLPQYYTRGTNQLHGGQFHHTRIDDGSQKKAMYKVEFLPAGKTEKQLIGYEVFLVRVQKATDMKVKIKDKITGEMVDSVVHYPEREATPGDGAFGTWAFQCSTLQSAQKKFDEMVIPVVQLDDDGNEIKRKRGRPAKVVA